MSAFCVVLSCEDRGLTRGSSLVQGVLPKCLNGSMVPEVNFEWCNPGKAQQ